jgi:hypothetical protein
VGDGALVVGGMVVAVGVEGGWVKTVVGDGETGGVEALFVCCTIISLQAGKASARMEMAKSNTWREGNLVVFIGIFLPLAFLGFTTISSPQAGTPELGWEDASSIIPNRSCRQSAVVDHPR